MHAERFTQNLCGRGPISGGDDGDGGNDGRRREKRKTRSGGGTKMRWTKKTGKGRCRPEATWAEHWTFLGSCDCPQCVMRSTYKGTTPPVFYGQENKGQNCDLSEVALRPAFALWFFFFLDKEPASAHAEPPHSAWHSAWHAVDGQQVLERSELISKELLSR